MQISYIPMLSQLLKESGYSTAYFGKWHLGPEPQSLLEHGFDVDISHWHGPGSENPPDSLRQGHSTTEQKNTTDRKLPH